MELEQKIIDELLKARVNLVKCNKEADDIELLVLTLLKTINSGQVRGVFSFRINGHTITNPQINELRISLEDVHVKITDGKPIITI